jgi:hypothetical protein
LVGEQVTMAIDLHARFHETWLGMVQPVDGLVVSIPVLVEAQCMERHGSVLQEKLHALCPLFDREIGRPLDGEDVTRTQRERLEQEKRKREAQRRCRDLRQFLAELLEWPTDLVDRGDALPADLSLYIAEGHQKIAPTLALKKLGSNDERERVAAPVDTVPQGDEQEAPDNEDDDEGEESTDEEGDEEDGGDDGPQISRRSLKAVPDIETPESIAGKPYVALVWELPAGLDFDKPETETGEWRYPPAAKFDRLLRACRVPIGLLSNGEAIRLIYAPHGEATGSITFDLTDMGEVGGRPILDAFVMLLSAQRFFGVRAEDALPALLRRSRERQANVTNALAAQVFSALDVLLRGFEVAAERDSHADLRSLIALSEVDETDPDHVPDDHLYGGLLTVLLRLVFVLYAEDRGLLPTDDETYAKSLSLGQLFEDLQRDQGAFPDTMSRRFGAWSRLLALFRTIYDGVEHGALRIPRRRGELFNPSRFPFLEGWQLPDTAVASIPEHMADVKVPTVDDETVYRILERLVILEGQRLSYKVLDVEQIGSVYEALMGYGVIALRSPAVCCRHKSLQAGSGGGVWIEASAVREVSPAGRSKFLIKAYDVVKSDAKKIAADLKAAKSDDEILDALEKISLRKVARRTAGQLALQPGEERRRTSSHYTPRSLSQPIVRRTLEPLLAAMSKTGEPTSKQILSLKVCDPAMGSGAFLVEACRFLADHLVAAWEREGEKDKIASAREDVVTHARRLVAQTCLYGVDKNPFAVSLAKLSLWLVTLAKEEPFTFVDHALRHGDSLVGLSFEQIKAFHWAPDEQMDFIEKELAACVAESLDLRQQILDRAGDSSPGTTTLKEQLLWDANDAQQRARLIGDLIVGAFFEVPKKEREAERKRRLEIVRRWLAEGGAPPADVRGMSAKIRAHIPVFHWRIEFPEVFHAERPDPLNANRRHRGAQMDAFVGNPPFGGKNRINDVSGNNYIPWLQTTHSGAHGNADLCAHFFRRSYDLLGDHGAIGFIATNTISQGDTRATGLQELLKTPSVQIAEAIRSMEWPVAGTAVSVAVVHITKGSVTGRGVISRLDGHVVPCINSRLRPKPERPDPQKLAGKAIQRSQGLLLQGDFTLSKEEARDYLKSAKNRKVVFPYLGGSEINTSPDQSFHRYVINFGTRSLEEAEAWPELLQRVRTIVKPARDRLGNNAVALQAKKIWWRFWAPRPELQQRLGEIKRCLVTAIVSKHLMFSFQPTDRVFSHKLQVFVFEDYARFAVLQSRVHVAWAWLLSSTMRNAGINYSASDCFDTFPFPSDETLSTNGALEAVGADLYDVRAKLMLERNEGLTTTYNYLKNPEVTDPEIEHLRELHLAMDRSVLRAYGWDDIAVPPFTDPVTDADWRAKEKFDDEVIDRLFTLNAERATEERLLGASTVTEKRSAGRKQSAPKGQLTLPTKTRKK